MAAFIHNGKCCHASVCRYYYSLEPWILFQVRIIINLSWPLKRLD